MMYISIAEITPVTDYGRKDCPYNCADCIYFDGIVFGDMVRCNLAEDK